MTEVLATPKPGLPLWAKSLVVLVVTVVFVCIVSLTSLVNFSASIAKKARVPAYITSVMQAVAEMPSTLPDGFSYQTAAEINNYRFVSFLYKPDDSLLAFISMPVDAKLDDSALIVQELSSRGLPAVSDSFQVDKKGQESVAGHTMDYTIGKTMDRDGTGIGTMIGCIVDKGKNKQLLMYGWSLKGDFDFAVAKKLLDAIKSM
ncbi:MAG: hypothetical protein K2W95_22540 [Candidatus Obscuribacterales bacterium]|nr:hypothetical protein [Candidatus Obscuribacterales bacterium]